MDDRPEELRRQRALIAAHLRWLDEEIARSSGTKPAPASSDSAPASAPKTETVPAPNSGEPASSDVEMPAGFALPEVDPNSIRSEVKRGCLVYVIVVSLLLIASVAVVYWTATSE